MGLELKIERNFDPATNRHFMNQVNTVFHCHHYAALYAQMADDAGELFDGLRIMEESARDSFYPIISGYLQRNAITDLAEKASLIEKYWALAGMGKLSLTDFSKEGGTVEMPFSHIDAGWIKKWGNRDKPINYLTAGFLSAAFSAIFELPVGSYEITETQSIVSGAEKSVFSVKLKN